jgi:hypothetical protein
MRRIILILSIFAMLSGLGLLIISLPVPVEINEIPVTFGDKQNAVLTITTPKYLRLGDTSSIQLSVSLNPEKTTDPLKSIKLKSNLVTTQLEVSPTDAVTAIIPENGRAEFRWKITAHNGDEQRATIWCFTQGSNGLELILARDVSLQVKTFLEMRFSLARWILGEVILLCLILIAVTVYRARKH